MRPLEPPKKKKEKYAQQGEVNLGFDVNEDVDQIELGKTWYLTNWLFSVFMNFFNF